jgi:macrodomain Ter protein organizer (MatP/YcbG family)
MNTKLTLSLKKSVIEKAKKYAKENGESLSAMIQSYLENVTQVNEDSAKYSPKVNSLKGSFKIEEDINYKEELNNALEEKYLK